MMEPPIELLASYCSGRHVTTCAIISSPHAVAWNLRNCRLHITYHRLKPFFSLKSHVYVQITPIVHVAIFWV